MPTKKPFISVRIDYLQAAIEALDYKAHDEAGHSQGHEAFRAEDTYDHEAARAIEAAIERQALYAKV